MFSRYLYLVLVVCITLGARAAPTPAPSLSIRQAGPNDLPFDGPRTIQTNKVIPVVGGNIVQDCLITFTPIVVDGKQLVREEQQCSELFVPTGQPLPSPSPPISTSQPPPATTTIDPPVQTTIVSTTSSESVSTPPPAETSTTTDNPATTQLPPPPPDTSSAPPAESTTTVAAPSSTTEAPPPPPVSTDTGAPNPPPATSSEQGGASDTVVVLGPTTVPAAGASTGTAEGQNAPSGTRSNAESTQAPVQVPGKNIEVLPIGLGVFAGISVIALIVVGLVTYERTKYRKAFRQRRLAASGAEMGYGGMSERR